MLVAFYKSKERLFNRAVAWWTNGEYSHVEVVLERSDSGRYLCGSSSHMDGGVRLKEIDVYDGHWDILEVDFDQDAVRSWFVRNQGVKYDILGLLGFVGRRGTQDAEKQFCSEAVGSSLGLKEPWRFDPNTLARVLEFIGGEWQTKPQ